MMVLSAALPVLKRLSSALSSLPKKACRRSNVFLATGTALCSSSEEQLDSDDDTSYKADQMRAKRRASTRMPPWLLNSDLGRAVSQYSDDDHPSAPTQTNTLTDLHRVVTPLLPPAALHLRLMPLLRRLHLEPDLAARLRCLDYLVGSIDAAWARYCDMTACAEEEVYCYGNIEKVPDTPASIATDDEGYRSESTVATDYDTDFAAEPVAEPTSLRRSSMFSTAASPSLGKLQDLKARLMKAKYYLQDFVDATDARDCALFWRRWDLVKYATIEVAEDDDCEEVIEETVTDLERGRMF